MKGRSLNYNSYHYITEMCFFSPFLVNHLLKESDHFWGSRGHMAFRSFNVCEEYKHQMTVFSSASTKNPVKEPLTFEHQQQNQHY